MDLADKAAIDALFESERFDIVVNLAAQAGVRYSITNPDANISSNIVGFYNVLEVCRHFPVKHLVYASSSSMYGTNKKMPYATEDKVSHPVSLYAATKISNELMAHVYAKLYGISCTGLCFFTVYGPMGRPDIAYYCFTEKMIRSESVQLHNFGDMRRDFTYIDDIVTGIINVMARVPGGMAAGDVGAYNVGTGGVGTCGEVPLDTVADGLAPNDSVTSEVASHDAVACGAHRSTVMWAYLLVLPNLLPNAYHMPYITRSSFTL